ncbi:LTA synthase family protein [Ornithinibacillus sp. BX22]|uniref:LTA synthase family protein n=2 Tax=Ornithinibacillus TaxID=484508 RepID=A0A923RJ69_9BACI|nr:MULTISPECIES: LTA synthase family protein [Ornithinibacillus]MBC5637208.1 LTA synthase family protein [Ornithinibacillus hominis]MBS3679581.1 LTA synthase family protein [Ornithinibacillus massiliensis]
MKSKGIRLPLYVLATLLFGLKTYIVYRFLFSLDLENSMQEFILLINPFVSAFLIFGLSVWITKPERQMKYVRYMILIGTLIIFANLVFYRSFSDFITVPQLIQGGTMGDLGSSILSLIKMYDILLFLDVIVIWYLSKKHQELVVTKYPRSGKVCALALSLALLVGNFFLAEMERPQLFTRAFDREYLVKYIGLFNYHVYDVVLHSKVKTQHVFADGSELPTIKEYVDNVIETNGESELFGVAKDKNVIFISAESLQTFVINNTVNGQEVTPFLNRLIEDEDTYYFENFYHQTEQGKTSDSEFLTENSLYPLPRGAVFYTHAQNDYYALPEMLGNEGYHTTVFHANNDSFYNRDQMYPSLGFDHFYDVDAYEVNDYNSVGWGLKDKPFFEQSMKYLTTLTEPYYAKFITLTNHFPFELDEMDKSIERYDSNSNTLNNYFPTVRYMDESIEEFFQMLKDSGIYDKSIIIIMGDHYGISSNHNKAMSMYLEKDEITPYDHVQLQRVPLFIHIPGHGKGEARSTISGQIDLKPTILSLLGIEHKDDIYFGNDLFVDDRKDYIALRNGDVITNDYIYTNDSCYDFTSGEVLEEADTCFELSETVKKELEYSDSIIYGDLFRFFDSR